MDVCGAPSIMHLGAGMASSIPFHPMAFNMNFATFGLIILMLESKISQTISRIRSERRFWRMKSCLSTVLFPK